MSLDLDKIHDVALAAALEGRKVLLEYFGRLSQVSEKENQGLVSEADVTSEKVITEYLQKAYPEFTVVGEESSFAAGKFQTQKKAKGGQWILDPLDGTTNYIHGFYVYSISLALEYDGEIVYGLVDVPALSQTYWTKKGHGAFKDAVQLQVSQRDSLDQALAVTGFASSRPEVLKSQTDTFVQMIGKFRGIRRTGSAAYDLCLVAEGIFDAYWEEDLNAWDTAAGALLVQEAGGQVSDLNGNAFDPHRRDIVAASTKVHGQLISHLSSFRPVKK